MRWLLGREPRIVDYIAIAVIAPLLVAGVIWIVSVAAQSSGKSHEYYPSTQRLASGRNEKTQEKGATRLVEPVYLDDLPKENGSEFELGPVSIGGHTYEHGIQFEVDWIATEWEVNYIIPHNAHTFSAIIGNDDHQTEDLWMYMSLLYEVFADGHLVGSGHVKGYSHDGPIHADVAGKTRLTLKVKVVSGLNSTKADWAEPIFQ
jgi:NPCBM/NEW2 domain-containing protein